MFVGLTQNAAACDGEGGLLEGWLPFAQQLHFEMLESVLARNATEQVGLTDRPLAGMAGSTRPQARCPVTARILELLMERCIVLRCLA